MNGLAGPPISGVAPPDSEMRAIGLPVAPEGIGPVVVQRSRCAGSPVWGERHRFGEESPGLVQARLAIPRMCRTDGPSWASRTAIRASCSIWNPAWRMAAPVSRLQWQPQASGG